MMNRCIEEVVASQDAMLQRRAKHTEIEAAEIATILQHDLDRVQEWLKSASNFHILNLSYNSIIVHPESAAGELNEFLGGGLDTHAMSGVMDVSLYRHRRS